MNKRYLTIFIIAGILTSIIALVLMMRTGGAERKESHPSNRGRPSISNHVQSAKHGSQSSAQTKAGEKQDMIIIKPKSIKMGQGAAAVVEIDHGLQAVDFMKGDKYSAAVDEARRTGAMGAVSFLVVDDRGVPVQGAAVRGGFWNNGGKGYDFEKATDESGVIAFESKCTGDLNFTITKDGHYQTKLRYWFFKARFDCVKDGKWIPWNPTIEITLKRKVAPVAMHVHRGIDRLTLPKRDDWMGFDLEHADWVAPYGKGKREDFQVFFHVDMVSESGGFSKFTLTLRFPKPFDGMYLVEKDNRGSEFQTVYEADTSRVYDNERTFTYERGMDEEKKKMVMQDHLLKEDEYLVLRVRSEMDKNGGLIKANYAKLYAPIFAAKYGFLITSYFNPEINNPSLEADMSKNLLNPRDLGFAP